MDIWQARRLSETHTSPVEKQRLAGTGSLIAAILALAWLSSKFRMVTEWFTDKDHDLIIYSPGVSIELGEAELKLTSFINLTFTSNIQTWCFELGEREIIKISYGFPSVSSGNWFQDPADAKLCQCSYTLCSASDAF